MHLPEILALHDLSRDPGAGSPEEFRVRSLANASSRCLHQHVFDEESARGLLAAAGLEVRVAEVSRPLHLCLIATAPPRGEVTVPPVTLPAPP